MLTKRRCWPNSPATWTSSLPRSKRRRRPIRVRAAAKPPVAVSPFAAVLGRSSQASSVGSGAKPKRASRKRMWSSMPTSTESHATSAARCFTPRQVKQVRRSSAAIATHRSRFRRRQRFARSKKSIWTRRRRFALKHSQKAEQRADPYQEVGRTVAGGSVTSGRSEHGRPIRRYAQRQRMGEECLRYLHRPGRDRSLDWVVGIGIACRR